MIRTYQIRFITGLFVYPLLLTSDKEDQKDLEDEVRQWMRKTYKVSSGEVVIKPLELGIIEL